MVSSARLPFFVCGVPRLAKCSLSFRLFRGVTGGRGIVNVGGSSRDAYRAREFEGVTKPSFIVFGNPSRRLLTNELVNTATNVNNACNAVPRLCLRLAELVRANSVRGTGGVRAGVGSYVCRLLSFNSLCKTYGTIVALECNVSYNVPELPVLPMDGSSPGVGTLTRGVGHLITRVGGWRGVGTWGEATEGCALRSFNFVWTSCEFTSGSFQGVCARSI